MKGELFLFLRKGEDIPVFDGEFTIENHYEFLSSVWIYGCYSFCWCYVKAPNKQGPRTKSQMVPSFTLLKFQMALDNLAGPQQESSLPTLTLFWDYVKLWGTLSLSISFSTFFSLVPILFFQKWHDFVFPFGFSFKQPTQKSFTKRLPLSEAPIFVVTLQKSLQRFGADGRLLRD